MKLFMRITSRVGEHVLNDRCSISTESVQIEAFQVNGMGASHFGKVEKVVSLRSDPH